MVCTSSLLAMLSAIAAGPSHAPVAITSTLSADAVVKDAVGPMQDSVTAASISGDVNPSTPESYVATSAQPSSMDGTAPPTTVSVSQSSSDASVVAAPTGQFLSVDIADTKSIKNAAAVIADSMLTPYYAYQKTLTGNDAVTLRGMFKGQLWWWWTAGAAWASMIDYWAVTKDDTYTSTITDAILAQRGEDDNFMPSAMDSTMGNDDIAFWTFTALNAAEFGFPEPSTEDVGLTWLQLAINGTNSLKSRWNTNKCGGLRWQAFASSGAGYNYINSITNGAYFQIAARLYSLTNDTSWADLATQVWDFSVSTGLVDTATWQVYDGFDSNDTASNCKVSTKQIYLYNHAVYMYGAAVMAHKQRQQQQQQQQQPQSSASSGSSSTDWSARTGGLVASALKKGSWMSSYGSYAPSADEVTISDPVTVKDDNVLWSHCEMTTKGCSHDDQSHKAYLASWLAKTALLLPDGDSDSSDPDNNESSTHRIAIQGLLNSTARAIVENKVCLNDKVVDGNRLLTLCGSPWFVDEGDVVFKADTEDFTPQFMSALEVLVSLLLV